MALVCETPDCGEETRQFVRSNGRNIPACRRCLHLAQLAAALAANLIEAAKENE